LKYFLETQVKRDKIVKFGQEYGEFYWGQNSFTAFPAHNARHIGKGINGGGYWQYDLANWLGNLLNRWFGSSKSKEVEVVRTPKFTDLGFSTRNGPYKLTGIEWYKIPDTIFHKSVSEMYENGVLKSSDTTITIWPPQNDNFPLKDTTIIRSYIPK